MPPPVLKRPGSASRISIQRPIRSDPEIEKVLARQMHFRPQGKGAILIEVDHSPGIESIPVPEPIGILSASAKAWSAHQSIHPAANLPQPIGIPAMLAANPTHGPKYSPRESGDSHFAFVAKHRAAGPVRLALHRARHGPIRLHQV
jgi:hypothetical protein